MPGGALLVLGDLGHLSVTVYLPEDRYGEVHLGDVRASRLIPSPPAISRAR